MEESVYIIVELMTAVGGQMNEKDVLMVLQSRVSDISRAMLRPVLYLWRQKYDLHRFSPDHEALWQTQSFSLTTAAQVLQQNPSGI